MVMFGLRFDLRNPGFAGVPMGERYRAALDMAEWADRSGALFVVLSEHHGADDGYLPSPLTMAAAMAARTDHVRLSINALVAPFHEPLRLAEDIAVVDLISGGRLDVTIAGGYARHEFEMFGVPLSERPRRVREAVATLRSAWLGEPFEYRGRTVVVRPTPTRPGGPAITLGGSSEAAARRAARIADGFLPSEPRFWDFYRDECLVLGRPDPGPWFGGTTDVTLLAEDPEEAWARLLPHLLHEASEYGALRADDDVATSYRVPVDGDDLRASGQYRIVTPAAYAAELDARGDSALVVLHPMVGGIPPEEAWAQLRLFEDRVLPHLTRGPA
jgi:alkanesulfonate monooxygenase SsuD/methylene tetrahydromethanopterin reductase-like flavin-dependent oxidoreductase (luciferase family)